MSLNYLNISIFYLVNNWYLFYLNTSPPLKKTTRTRWIQESLQGKPTSDCFPEAMREHGVETTLPLFANLLAFKHHRRLLMSCFLRVCLFTYTHNSCSLCRLLQWHRVTLTWDLIALYQWGPHIRLLRPQAHIPMKGLGPRKYLPWLNCCPITLFWWWPNNIKNYYYRTASLGVLGNQYHIS